MYGSYGRELSGAYADSDKKCARLQTRYEKLRAKGRNMRRLNRVKRSMDAACKQAAATTNAFEEAYQSPAEVAMSQAAQAGVTQASVTSATGSSNLLPILLVGGAGLLVVLLLVSSDKGEKVKK